MKQKIFVFVVLFMFLCGCTKKPDVINSKRFLMDTIVDINARIDGNKKYYEEFVNNAFDEIQRINDDFDRYKEGSKIDKFNKRILKKIDEEFYDILSFAFKMSEYTYGAFDITVAPLLDLWDLKKEEPNIPSRTSIINTLKYVGYNKVKHDEFFNTFIMPENMYIDLGAVVKGYAVDRAVNILRNGGINSAFINAGGDLYAIGSKNGNPWKVGIQHPRNSEELLGVLEIEDKAVVTSGDYERFFIHNGKRYHHIIDPFTGYPSKGIISITVVSSSCEYADGLATGLFILGKERAIELVKTLHDIDVIIVTEDMQILVSKNLKFETKLDKEII